MLTLEKQLQEKREVWKIGFLLRIFFWTVF